MKLSEKSYEKILDRKVYGPDSVIFREGDSGSMAFVVLRGEVGIMGRTEKDEPVALTTLGPGEMFGEMALLTKSKRSSTALTKSGCELMVIKESVIDEKLSTADPFLKFWIEYLTGRVIDLSSRIEK